MFLVCLIVAVCTCGSILSYTGEKACDKCSIDLKLLVWEHYMPCALEKIMMVEVSCGICANVYEGVICDTCDPWYALSISLFMVNSYHSIQKSIKKYKLGNKMDCDSLHPRLCNNRRDKTREKSITQKSVKQYVWQIKHTNQGHLPTNVISDIDFTDDPVV